MSTLNYFKHQYLQDFGGVYQNIICLSNDTITINMTLDQFLVFVPEYQLPEGYQERDYIQDNHNKLYKPDGEIVEDIVPWTEGDFYIANAQNYIPVPPED